MQIIAYNATVALRRAIEFGTRPLKEEEIARREIYGIKAQRVPRAGQAPLQIRAGAVDKRHEVVADHRHACLGDGDKRILPCTDVPP